MIAHKKFISLSILVAMLVLVGGCGKADDPGDTPPPSGGGSGVTPPGGGTPGANWCQFPTLYPDGTQKCSFSLVVGPPGAGVLTCTPGMPCPPPGTFQYWGLDTVSGFPKLNNNPLGYATTVLADDTLLFQGSGSYGQADSSSWLGSGCGDDDLEEISIGGWHDANQVFTSNGLPAALLAKVSKTTGTPDYYNLGELDYQVINNSGTLTWGINSPYTRNCHVLAIQRLEIQRCRNSAGASVLCPQP